jgi:hypothetical protein
MIFYKKFGFNIRNRDRILPLIPLSNIIVLDDKKLKRKCTLTVIFGQEYRVNVDLWVFDGLEP